MLEDFGQWLAFRYIMRVVMGAVGIFVVSLVMSCQELGYMMSGKTVEATATTDVQVERLEGGGTRQKKVLGYFYNDGDKQYRKFINITMDSEPGPTVRVQYLPGRGISRLEGQRNWMWVGILFGSLAVAVGGFVALAIKGSRD